MSKQTSGGAPAMLSIRNLHACVRVDQNQGELTGAGESKEILKGLSLEVEAGQVHALMGPNGAGKSTLAGVLTGRDAFTVTSGEVLYKGQDLLAMAPELRAREGVFLSFQYPVEIPGVSTAYFLRTALNSVRRHQGREEMDAFDFLALSKSKAASVGLKPEFLNRSLNEGFSGGEKKRNEIFQMVVLEPSLAILDETDSGLDVDALRAVADGVNALRSPDRVMLVITHYQRLLDYIVPDATHILMDGRIVRSGDKELALEVEKNGYTRLSQTGEQNKPDGRANSVGA